MIAGDHGAYVVAFGARPCHVGDAPDRGDDKVLCSQYELCGNAFTHHRMRHRDEATATFELVASRLFRVERQHSVPGFRRGY